MKKGNKFAVLFSLALIPLVAGILFADLAGTFSYSDVPFVLAFFIYLIFIYIQRSSSRASFLAALYLLVVMGLSYIPTGAGVVTERIGEWFFLFFACGLIQYFRET